MLKIGNKIRGDILLSATRDSSGSQKKTHTQLFWFCHHTRRPFTNELGNNCHLRALRLARIRVG